jgi:hypothetical protein
LTAMASKVAATTVRPATVLPKRHPPYGPLSRRDDMIRLLLIRQLRQDLPAAAWDGRSGP